MVLRNSEPSQQEYYYELVAKTIADKEGATMGPWQVHPSSSSPPSSLPPPSSPPPSSLLPIALFKFLLYIRLVICGYITDEVPAINPSVAEWANSINATVELLNVAKLSSKDGVYFFLPFCFRFSIYSLISFNH